MNPFAISKVLGGCGILLLPIQVRGVERKRLSDALRGAWVSSISIVESHSLRRTWFARALLSSGGCIDFTSSTTEVGNWVDVGTMNVEVFSDPPIIDKELSTYPLEAFVIEMVSLLVVEEGEVVAEAGIVLSGSEGRDIQLVAGEIPGSFSVGLPGEASGLDSRFPMERYRRVGLEK